MFNFRNRMNKCANHLGSNFCKAYNVVFEGWPRDRHNLKKRYSFGKKRKKKRKTNLHGFVVVARAKQYFGRIQDCSQHINILLVLIPNVLIPNVIMGRIDDACFIFCWLLLQLYCH